MSTCCAKFGHLDADLWLSNTLCPSGTCRVQASYCPLTSASSEVCQSQFLLPVGSHSIVLLPEQKGQ